MEILTFYFFTLIDKNLVCYSYLEAPVYMPFVHISELFFNYAHKNCPIEIVPLNIHSICLG